VISRMDAWHRGQAIPLRLFEMPDTDSPDRRTRFRSIRRGSNGFPACGRDCTFLWPKVRLTERDCGEKNTREFGPWSGIRPTSVPFLANHLRQRAHCCFFDAMPIRQYLDGERFDLETTRLLGLAFETAIQALHNWGVDDPPRAAIARAIIGFAKAGERDLERLCDLALEACSKSIITDPNPLPPHASPPVPPDS
jgi:hypothetical protein